MNSYFVRTVNGSGINRGWIYEHADDAMKCARVIFHFVKNESDKFIAEFGNHDIPFDVEVCRTNIIGLTKVHYKLSKEDQPSGQLDQNEINFLYALLITSSGPKAINTKLIIPKNRLIEGPRFETCNKNFRPIFANEWTYLDGEDSHGDLDRLTAAYLCSFGKSLGSAGVPNPAFPSGINTYFIKFYIHPEFGIIGHDDENRWRLLSKAALYAFISDPEHETRYMSPDWQATVEKIFRKAS